MVRPPHVVLVGDSTLDNAAYTDGAPDVATHLRSALGSSWRATLLAWDGATVADVAEQLATLPGDAGCLVVSIGGNDVLPHIGLLSQRVPTVGDALAIVGAAVEGFERSYRGMLGGVADIGIPTALCTIYHPRFPDQQLWRLATHGVALFDDVVVRAAVEHGMPLIDLRAVCTDDADFVNVIEPSARGGQKIAAAIARLVAEHDFERGVAAVYTG